MTLMYLHCIFTVFQLIFLYIVFLKSICLIPYFVLKIIKIHQLSNVSPNMTAQPPLNPRVRDIYYTGTTSSLALIKNRLGDNLFPLKEMTQSKERRGPYNRLPKKKEEILIIMKRQKQTIIKKRRE